MAQSPLPQSPADRMVLGARAAPRLRAWLTFAVASLGIAGALAFVVAMIKTPAVKPLISPATFRMVLVGHVTYAMTVWCMAFLVCLWVFAAADRRDVAPLWAQGNRWVAMLGAAGILLATGGSGVPLLLDYVPIIDSPLFLGGLGLFLVGIAGEWLRFHAARQPGARGALHDGMTATGVAVAVAACTLVLNAMQLGRDATDPQNLQALVWGVGHVVQYVYVIAMVVCWWLLAHVGLGQPWPSSRYGRGVLTLAVLLSLSTPLAALLLGAAGLRSSLRASVIVLSLLACIAPFAAVPIIARSIRERRRGRRASWNPQRSALWTSIALFTVGVLLDPAGHMGTLWVPAHYHGVIVGGVTIAFMGAIYHLIERCGCRLFAPRLAAWQPLFYGLGVATMIAGLAWAGAEGAVRKDWVHGIVVNPGFTAGLNMMGVGAAIAVCGGAAFVYNALFSLLRAPRSIAILDMRQQSGEFRAHADAGLP